MVPAELKQLPQWIVWRLEERDGKPTKVPYRADGQGKAAVDAPKTWGTARVAFERWKTSSNGHSFGGVGFVVTKEDPYCGIDLDHCLNKKTGQIEEWALAIVQRFDSYTEVTPSESGLRVWIKGKLPGPRNRTGSIELYDHDRYFTTTGWRLEIAPEEIQERQQELEAFYAELFPAMSKPPQYQPPTVSFDAREVIERARRARNGAAFERLMRGDISGYASASEADLALASKAAFWNPDPAVMEQVIRQSQLWDEKWERPDYLERTIRKGIERREFYSGSAPTPPPASSTNGSEPPSQQPDAEDPEEEELASSWAPADLALILRNDLSPLEPVCLTRRDGTQLLYPGRCHMFLGEPESCKSWAAQIAVAGCLNEGKNALYIDNEAEARDVIGHLRAMGVGDDKMLAHLFYVRPEDPFDQRAQQALFGALAQREPMYISVIDGVNTGMVSNGLEPNSNKDVAQWWTMLARPIQRQTKGPTVLIDHVAKDSTTRGDWAVGAGQKKALVDGAMVAFQVINPFGVGRTALIKMTLFKDRPGYLRGHQGSSKELAQMRLVSEDGVVTYEFLNPSGAAEGEPGQDTWKPTGYMEKVSRAVTEAPAPLSKNAIEVTVTGKAKYIRTALEILVAEGYIEQISGPRNSVLHRSLRPYVEEEPEVC